MKIQTKSAMCTFLALLFSFPVFANFSHAPKSFSTNEGVAVFSDFESAIYDITYDNDTDKASAVSKIVFKTIENGLPIFDLVENPTKILLDGQLVSSKLIKTIDQETTVRVILKNIEAGTHTLEVYSPIVNGVKFSDNGVSSAFWFSDLNDRSYLEAYLPANFEYDQVQMTFNVEFKNSPNQKFFTNGELTKIDETHFKIEFPETYTSSSLYYHTAPIGKYPEVNFNFRSIDGRDLPLVIYTLSSNTNLENIKTRAIESLKELEKNYGPFLHKSITIFNAGSGGMEYSGATMTDLLALNHELTHSYFARGGFMPANGNSGWIDEALTSWSDEGRREISNLGNLSSGMASHSEYRRFTDMDAYSKGKRFVSFLNYKFKNQGGLKSFLNRLILDDQFKPMTTEEFITKISSFYGEDLKSLFKKHVYYPNMEKIQREKFQKRVPHMKLSINQMAKFL